MSEIAVDICIATYRRPQLLGRLLESIKNLNLNEVKLRVIIIDNDNNASARQLVENYRSYVSFQVDYVVERNRGISYARNRALDLVRAEYFAFLDDDEHVPPHWLWTMLDTMMQFSADAVFGPVLKVLPDDTPSWFLKLPVFKQLPRATGTLLMHGATGNVLLRSESVRGTQLRFDPSYALTGGEDTDFFYRLYLERKSLIWCEEGTVYEEVPHDHICIAWMLRRAFRGGQSYYRVFVHRYPPVKKILYLLFKTTQIIAGAFILPITRLMSSTMYISWLCRICAAAGQLSAVSKRFLYQEYNPKCYRSEQGYLLDKMSEETLGRFFNE